MMTGYTINNLAIARINHTLTNRMAELSLVFMALQTHFISIAFDHGRLVRTMDFMTGNTILHRGNMHIQGFIMLSERIVMATPA